jgi:hypothetical protein
MSQSDSLLTSQPYNEGWAYVSDHFHPVPKGEIHIDFALRSIDGLEMIRAGTKRKRGVVFVLGVFTWQPRQWANLVARVFNEGYRLEIHAKAPEDEIVAQVEKVTGTKFEPIGGARTV